MSELLLKTRLTSLLTRATKAKNISSFALSSILLNFSGLIAGIVIYKWVDPYYIGIWQSLLIIETYCAFLRLGVINGMNRQLPFWFGKGDHEKGDRILQTTMYYTLLIMVTVLVFSIPLFFFTSISEELKPVILIAVVYIVLNIFNSYLLGTFRSGDDFNKLKRIQNVQACLKIVLISLVVYFGFYGYMFGQVILLLITMVFTFFSRPFKHIHPKFYKEEFIELIKIGLPIFIGSYLLSIINTIPRLFLLNFGNLELIGIFAPLLTIISVVMVIPDSFTTFLYPKMVYHYSKTDEKKGLWLKTVYTQIGLVLIGVPIFLFGYFLLPDLIQQYLPKYIKSIDIIKSGIFIVFFSGYKFAYSTFVVLKKWKFIFSFITIFLVAQLAFPYIFMNYYPLLKAVVFGQLAASVVTSIVALVLCYKVTH